MLFLLSQCAFLSINDAVTNGTEIGSGLAPVKKTIMTAVGYKYNAGTVFPVASVIAIALVEDFIYVEGYFEGREDDTYWIIIDRKTYRLVKTNRPGSIFFIRNFVDNITDIYETTGTLPEERLFVWY